MHTFYMVCVEIIETDMGVPFLDPTFTNVVAAAAVVVVKTPRAFREGIS